jgi:hypothetical protein
MKSNPHPATRGQESSDALTMVERVAEAITLAAVGKGNRPNARMRRIARAAIEAMREPTEEMVSAGADAEPTDYNGGPIPKDARKFTALVIYRAMIDAALKEGE